MPSEVFPFSGPLWNARLNRFGLAAASSVKSPSYSAPMPLVINRAPFTVIHASAGIAPIFCPSSPSAAIRHVPCSLSRSVFIFPATEELYSPQIVPKIAQPELRDFLATAYTPPPRRRRPPRFSILGSNAVRRSRRYLAPRLGDFAAPGKDRPARGAPRPARSRGSRDCGGDAFRLYAPGPHRGIGRAS